MLVGGGIGISGILFGILFGNFVGYLDEIKKNALNSLGFIPFLLVVLSAFISGCVAVT